MEFLKSFLKNHKKIVIAILIPVILFIIAVFVVAAKLTFDEREKNREFERKTQEFQAELERPYREDVYGGKTPEETWNMFLDALKKGDIDLASKYFAVGKQGEYRDILEKSQEDNELNQWIKEMEKLRKDEDQPFSTEKAYYFYNVFSKNYQQILSNSVVFYFNSYTEVWKILVL